LLQTRSAEEKIIAGRHLTGNSIADSQPKAGAMPAAGLPTVGGQARSVAEALERRRPLTQLLMTHYSTLFFGGMRGEEE
jgi:hypothetical protein